MAAGCRNRPTSTLTRVEMVRLLTTLDQFEARVLAARLGAEGVLWELRGGHDGPYPMGPVHVFVEASDLEAAIKQYAATLADLAGSPPVLDLAHLGMGPDGHTASLVPGDPVLTMTNTDVALTRVYMGRRRMTLTYPILNRSRRILFLVTGKEKVKMLSKLLAADNSIPSGRIRQDNTVILADRGAADRAAAS